MTDAGDSLWESPGARAALKAFNPARFIVQHIAPLFYHRWAKKESRYWAKRESRSERDKVFISDQEFWQASSTLIFSTVRLQHFKLTDWFPRAPGVFWSTFGERVR